MSLYHREVGFPACVELPKGKFSLEWSEHAQQQCVMDINGAIKVTPTIILDPYRIFEVQLSQDQKIEKFAYRTRYNGRCDITYVFIPQGENLFIKTVWLNRRSDKHFTLDVSKYDTP